MRTLHCLDKSSKHEGSTETKIIFPIDLLTSQQASAHLCHVMLVGVYNCKHHQDQISESYGIQVSPGCCLAAPLKRGEGALFSEGDSK